MNLQYHGQKNYMEYGKTESNEAVQFNSGTAQSTRIIIQVTEVSFLMPAEHTNKQTFWTFSKTNS